MYRVELWYRPWREDGQCGEAHVETLAEAEVVRDRWVEEYSDNFNVVIEHDPIWAGRGKGKTDRPPTGMA